MNLAQMIERNAICHPSSVAIVHDKVRLTWSTFAERIACLSAGLGASGLETGDRVAILADNSHRYMELMYAAPWFGAITVPLNHRLSDLELLGILEDCKATMLVTDGASADRARRLKAQAAELETLVWADDEPAQHGFLDYENLIDSNQARAPAQTDGNDLIGIFYTGGTTGRPKGVMHTHTNLWTSALSYATMMGLSPSTVSLCSAPLFHVAAMSAAVPALMVGGAVVVLSRYDTDAVIDAIADERVTIANFVPAMLRMLVDNPRLADADLSSLDTVIYGAAPMPPALLDEVLAALPRTNIRHAYGMTELTACITILAGEYNRPERREEGRWRSAGHAVIGADVRIFDEDDCEVPRGTVGEICARGPMVMAGYWNQREATDQALRGGWMHTGDAGYIDEQGFLFVVDRLKDMIISGGENVYSAEVEAAISLMEGVHQCAVFGVPHQKWGEAVHAVIVPKPGASLDAESVIAHCREQIAGYKLPRSIEVRTEPLPLSGANKVLKRDLRAAHLEQNAGHEKSNV